MTNNVNIAGDQLFKLRKLHVVVIGKKIEQKRDAIIATCAMTIDYERTET